MLREADKVDIVREGLADLHEAEPDRQRFTPAEIGLSAFRHHPRYNAAKAEAGKLPRFLRNQSIMGRLLSMLELSGQVVSEFIKEDGSVRDMEEYKNMLPPKPSLDSRDKFYRLLDAVVEEPITTEVISQNGNGASSEASDGSGVFAEAPAADESKPPVFRPARRLHEPPGPHMM